MAYYYQDPNHDSYLYEYADDSNYSNHGYKDNYGSYLDNTKSPYSNPDPTNTRPDHYKDHEDVLEGHGYEHSEVEYEGESEQYELRELERGEDKIDKGLEYKGDEICKYGKFTYKPKHDAETHCATYEPHRFKHDNGETGECTHPHSNHTPTYIPPIPFPSPPSPTPTPCAHNTPHSNQQSHVTASKHAHTSNNGYDDERKFTNIDYGATEPTDHATSPIYTDLDIFCCDYNNGILEAITYMKGLQAYLDECLHEAMEEEAQYTLEHPPTPQPTPISPSPSTSTTPIPQPTPPACITLPLLNKQGHVSTFTDVNNDTGEHLMDHPPSTYTDLDTLCCDYDNGVPEAITYMEGL
ncbi:hypothetical protein PILCRDRAFT_14282 [Piloderma croceum F 1598]|uniref:Uncharacterized protein n=1 Tax=Piloderma croceum (strain F 1598) TaxID=765440 RepID=A0A0C3BBD4_PILCF|nr:hypothetical protein PILCRDRAFT_14282 [Piloderma croceum F 1598]